MIWIVYRYYSDEVSVKVRSNCYVQWSADYAHKLEFIFHQHFTQTPNVGNYRVAQKSKQLLNDQKIAINRIKSCQRLDFIVKLKYESSSIILFVGIRYSMRDLLSDLNNYVWHVNLRYASDTVNDGIASIPLASARLSKLWLLCLNDLSDGDLCKTIFYFHIFSFISGFQTWFYQMCW